MSRTSCPRCSQEWACGDHPSCVCMVDPPGSPEWWHSPAFAHRGPADTILRLLEQKKISRCKARDLLEYLSVVSHYDLRAEPAPPAPPPPPAPPAPWIKLNWCDDLPDIAVPADVEVEAHWLLNEFGEEVFADALRARGYGLRR